MIKYDNLKSENVENAGEVIRAFSLLLYGNTAGSMDLDRLIAKAMDNRQIKEKETKYVFYTWLTIDGFDKKYYKACGSDLTTKKSSAWTYTKSGLDFYESYRKQYEVEEVEGGECIE